MGAKHVKKQLQVYGMTCVSCPYRIEQKLVSTAGVWKASVSYQTGIADITYDPDIISLQKVAMIIEKMDYQVALDNETGKTNIPKMICMLAIILSLCFLLERYGILNLLIPGQLADSKMGYGMLFLIGLITSIHCVAMCGGINLSQCVPQGITQKRNRSRLYALRPALLYNIGRVASYTMIGFLLGLVGFIIGSGSPVEIPTVLQGIIKLIAGAFMVILGINMLNLFPWLHKFSPRMPRFLTAKMNAHKVKSHRPLIVGLLNGLMPCGPLQAMQLVALISGNPFSGAISMLLFSLGTVPLMLGLGAVVSLLGQKFKKNVMSVGSVLVIVLGLAMLSQGGSLSGLISPNRLLVLTILLGIVGIVASIPFKKVMFKQILIPAASIMAICIFILTNHMGVLQSNASASHVQITDGTQVVTSTLSSGSYPDITVQAGMPVKWVINAPEGSINGCNYKVLIQNYGIEYTFEEGENIIEFTPTMEGNVSYSCWMGMIRANILVTDSESDNYYR